MRVRLARMHEFEPRQAFERVARDRNRLEARDIFHYIDRFSNHETHTIEASHYLIRYWNQSQVQIGLTRPKLEEGSLQMADFCQMVLPQDNSVLRAMASQRVTRPADAMHLDVEVHLASLLRFESDMQETFERMKTELESLAGFSTKKAYKLLDVKGRGYLDVNSIRDFIVKHFNMDESSRAQK